MIRINPRHIVALFAFISVGCGASYKYARTTQIQTSPREKGCKVDLLTNPPARAYDEVGVLEPTDTVWYGSWASEAQDFIKTVRAQVCGAGGDAILPTVNNEGHYIKGTIIKYRPESDAVPTPET